MLKIQFKEHDSETLFSNFLREEHPKTRLKNLVIYCKSIGMSHGEILDFCRISGPTLASYLKEFQRGGFEALRKTKWKGQESDLNQYTSIIDDDFSKKPPKSAAEAQTRVEELTGIKRSPTQIRSFMKEKLGYRFLKAGSLPGNGKDDDDLKELQRQEFKKNSRTITGSSQKRRKNSAFYGCLTFYLRNVSGLFVVSDQMFPEKSCREESVQCTRGTKCNNEKSIDIYQRHDIGGI